MESHLPGAVFVELKEDLSDPVQEHGGRSPLPSPVRLAELFGNLGIDQSTAVVVYEDGNGPAAARLWWILKYLGLDNVFVLDGGYSAWKAAGLPVTNEIPQISSRTFIPKIRTEWLADQNEVKTALNRGETELVDSRDANQYLGLEAPFDPVTGRIPGSVNLFWKDGLAADGKWRSSEEQRKRFEVLGNSKEIIVYCGSGISACLNVLALSEAGYSNVKLYAGSWSDWISYPENPIERN